MSIGFFLILTKLLGIDKFIENYTKIPYKYFPMIFNKGVFLEIKS
jgi:hypothetical protein